MTSYANGFGEINRAFFVYYGVNPDLKTQPLAVGSEERMQRAYPDHWKSLKSDIELALKQLDFPAVRWGRLVPWSEQAAKEIDGQMAKVHPWMESNTRQCIIYAYAYSLNK